jgi:Arc/MetJ-type ribon-helix-helix transcriptional regulator
MRRADYRAQAKEKQDSFRPERYNLRMNISLSSQTQRLLKARMKQGGYSDPDDAVRAGLAYLEQQEHAAEFAPGELDRLLAVADAEIDRGATLDGATALRARRRRRARRSKKAE